MASAKHSNAPAQFNRRALLKALPAAAVAGAVPAVVVASEETPVMRVYRKWKVASEDFADPKWDSRSREDQDRVCVRVSDLQHQILELPAQSPQDFILKVMVYTYFGESGLPDEGQNPALWAEARALIG